MKKNFCLVRVDSKYCDYLREYDKRVPYNNDNKKLRPFVGILFEINECKYFAPLSSPKPKHMKMKDTIDFVRLDGGLLGAINFNNMIPVKANNVEKINLDEKCNTKEDLLYTNLLKSQIFWLNRHGDKMLVKAKALYFDFITNNLKENIKSRCCNFTLLEEKCNSFNRVANK